MGESLHVLLEALASTRDEIELHSLSNAFVLYKRTLEGEQTYSNRSDVASYSSGVGSRLFYYIAQPVYLFVDGKKQSTLASSPTVRMRR